MRLKHMLPCSARKIGTPDDPHLLCPNMGPPARRELDALLLPCSIHTTYWLIGRCHGW